MGASGQAGEGRRAAAATLGWAAAQRGAPPPPRRVSGSSPGDSLEIQGGGEEGRGQKPPPQCGPQHGRGPTASSGAGAESSRRPLGMCRVRYLSQRRARPGGACAECNIAHSRRSADCPHRHPPRPHVLRHEQKCLQFTPVAPDPHKRCTRSACCTGTTSERALGFLEKLLVGWEQRHLIFLSLVAKKNQVTTFKGASTPQI